MIDFLWIFRSSVFSETFNQSVEEPADIDLVLNDTEPHILGIFIKSETSKRWTTTFYLKENF